MPESLVYIAQNTWRAVVSSRDEHRLQEKQAAMSSYLKSKIYGILAKNWIQHAIDCKGQQTTLTEIKSTGQTNAEHTAMWVPRQRHIQENAGQRGTCNTPTCKKNASAHTGRQSGVRARLGWRVAAESLDKPGAILGNAKNGEEQQDGYTLHELY